MITTPQMRLPTGMNLYSFQIDGVARLLSCSNHSMYLADDMGLGKTIQAIVYANSVLARSVLIVCPASLRLNWYNEVLSWYTLMDNIGRCKAILKGTDINCLVLKGIFKKSAPPNVVIVSYDMLVANFRLYNYVYNRAWDLTILDEAHYIRSIKSKRTELVLRLWDKNIASGKKTVCLSGTPMMNSAADLYPFISRCLGNGVSGSFWEFVNYYCNVRQGRYGVEYKSIKPAKIAELKALTTGHPSNYFIRRYKEHVLVDLPSKTFSKLYLDLDIPKDSYDYERLSAIVDSETITDHMPFVSLRRLLGEAKISCEATWEIISNLLGDKGLVVFFYHKAVRDTFLSKLAEHDRTLKVVVHDGERNNTQKQYAVDTFQSGKADILLAQVEAASGYTVTRADTCIFLEWPWLPTQIHQATDRLHRIGQKSSVTAHFLISKNKLEQKLLNMLVYKAKGIEKVVG